MLLTKGRVSRGHNQWMREGWDGWEKWKRVGLHLQGTDGALQGTAADTLLL